MFLNFKPFFKILNTLTIGTTQDTVSLMMPHLPLPTTLLYNTSPLYGLVKTNLQCDSLSVILHFFPLLHFCFSSSLSAQTVDNIVRNHQ